MKKLLLVGLIVAFTASSGIQVPANATKTVTKTASKIATIDLANSAMMYAPQSKTYVPTSALNLQIWSKVVDPTLKDTGCVYRGLIGAYDYQGQNELSYLDDVVTLMGKENVVKLDLLERHIKFSDQVVPVKFQTKSKRKVVKSATTKLATSTLQVELPLAIKGDLIYNIPEITPHDGQTVYMTKTTPVTKGVDKERTFLWVCSTTQDPPTNVDTPTSTPLDTVFRSPLTGKEYTPCATRDMACLTDFYDPEIKKDSITKAYVNFVTYLTSDSPYVQSTSTTTGPRNALAAKYDATKIPDTSERRYFFSSEEYNWSAGVAESSTYLDWQNKSDLSSYYAGSHDMAHGFSMWWLTRAGNYKKARFQDLAIVANTRVNVKNTYEQFKKSVSADWSSFNKIGATLGWSASAVGVPSKTDYKNYLGKPYVGNNTNLDMSVYGVKYFIGEGEDLSLRNSLPADKFLSGLSAGDFVRDNQLAPKSSYPSHVYVAGYYNKVPYWLPAEAQNGILSLNQGYGKGPHLVVNYKPLRLVMRLPH